ncbi:MAG: hypothetical protein JST54_34695 [Deltaproteobacteria bacterium]|nr:hypothetical protein [Deltaproteobacteria bacterium]
MRFLVCCIVVALVCGAGHPAFGDDPKPAKPSAAPDSAPLPKFVRVEILSALVGPCKVDGTKWDGMGKCDAGAQDKIAKLLPSKMAALAAAASGLNPAGAATTILASVSTGVLAKEDKPDPYGIVEVAVGDDWKSDLKFGLLSEKKPAKDNFAPEFPPHEVKVPLEKGTRFRVQMFDKDLTKSDDIGRAEIGYDDLVAALNAGKIWQVPVADQTQNQLLFIGIEVRPVADSPNAGSP